MGGFPDDSFPFSYFLGEISAEFDSKGRPTHILYAEGEYPENYLKVDYDQQTGTYSDESFMAQNFNKGTVEEVHLGEIARTSKGVDFTQWIASSYLLLLKDVAIKHASYLFEYLDEDNTEHVEGYYSSFQLFLEKSKSDLRDHPNYLQLGWAACSLMLEKDVKKATAVFQALYQEEKDGLDISEEKLNQYLFAKPGM